jgi:activating signal cointegrator complex subunit 2
VRLHARAAQWEYDDEYDDSYDDLGGGGADGVADVEGAPVLAPTAACLPQPPA